MSGIPEVISEFVVEITIKGADGESRQLLIFNGKNGRKTMDVDFEIGGRVPGGKVAFNILSLVAKTIKQGANLGEPGNGPVH